MATPDLAHAAGAQSFHETVAADCESFVEELLVDLQHRALREDDRALDHGPQLADVARPRVPLQTAHRFRRHPVHDLAHLSRLLPHEMIDESGNVLSPVGQRGNRDSICGQHAAERLEQPTHLRRQIPCRGRDDPHVGHDQPTEIA